MSFKSNLQQKKPPLEELKNEKQKTILPPFFSVRKQNKIGTREKHLVSPFLKNLKFFCNLSRTRTYY